MLLIFSLFINKIKYDGDYKMKGGMPNFESNSKKSEKPTSVSIKFNWKAIFRIQEKCIVGIIIFYILFYIVGSCINNYRVKTINNILISELSNYFEYGNPIKRKSPNQYISFYTGRTEYDCCLLHISFSPICDPLGFIISLFSRHLSFSKISFEFLLHPSRYSGAQFYYFNKNLYTDKYPERSKTDTLSETDNSIVISSKIEKDMLEQFSSRISEFEAKYPNSIEMIELSDKNHFETQNNGKFVAKFDFLLPQFQIKVDNFINSEFFTFILYLSDTYLSLPYQKSEKKKMN